MPKKKLTAQQEKQWNQILSEIDMAYVPMEYVRKIVITFIDGAIWDIDLNDSRKSQTTEDIETSIEELVEEYEDNIDSIDFRIDFPRIKSDLSKRVFKFLKLNR